MNLYVVGQKTYPEWYVELQKDGRIIPEYRDGNLIGIKLKNSYNMLKAEVGDTILYSGGFVHVIPARSASKYMR